MGLRGFPITEESEPPTHALKTNKCRLCTGVPADRGVVTAYSLTAD